MNWSVAMLKVNKYNDLPDWVVGPSKDKFKALKAEGKSPSSEEGKKLFKNFFIIANVGLYQNKLSDYFNMSEAIRMDADEFLGGTE